MCAQTRPRHAGLDPCRHDQSLGAVTPPLTLQSSRYIDLKIVPLDASSRMLSVLIPWGEVVGFAGFAIYLPAVAGSADPCTEAAAF